MPFPPFVTESPSPLKLGDLPFFGHKDGNFQPQKAAPSNLTWTSTRFSKRAPGETVQNGADARFDNSNIQDGIGDGSDSYTMYWGGGASSEGWPTRDKWVSFENM